MRTKNSVIEDISKIFASDKTAVREVFDKLASLSKEHRDLFICLAALNDEDRTMLIDYWQKLWGDDFARDVVKDYVNRGDKKKVEAKSGKMNKVAALSGEDRSLVKQYWDSLRGNEFAGDMVQDYDNQGEKMSVEASKYEKIMHAYASILGEETINKLRTMDQKSAKKALQEIAVKVSKKKD